MKKLASILIALALVLALCGSAWAEEEKPLIVVGKLTHLAESDEEITSDTAAVAESPDNERPGLMQNRYEIITFHSLNEMMMALDAGQIQLINVDEPTVKYILSQSDAYVEEHPVVEQPLDYSMLFLDSNAALRDSFNTAIAAMWEDGTLGALAEQYIDGAIAGTEPEAVAFPSFDGADTITVAVTGDVPPMDYVNDAGEAAGFNTAVLAEIANRLQVNIELIQIDSGARTLALSGGRADVVFWVLHYGLVDVSDVPEGTIASDPYYTTVGCNIVRKAG